MFRPRRWRVEAGGAFPVRTGVVFSIAGGSKSRKLPRVVCHCFPLGVVKLERKKAGNTKYFRLSNSWRRRGDSDFFSEANKIKDLAFRILVKIAQGHQKGHQKILKELTIENKRLIKVVYRKKRTDLNSASPQWCRSSVKPTIAEHAIPSNAPRIAQQ